MLQGSKIAFFATENSPRLATLYYFTTPLAVLFFLLPVLIPAFAVAKPLFFVELISAIGTSVGPQNGILP